jgi:AraC-like DNA-binding protein
MDKIDFAKWENHFSRSQESCVFSSDRYAETLFSFEGDDLPGGNIKTVMTQGFTLTELHMHTRRPFQLLDTQEKEGAESLFVLKGDVESSFTDYKHPLRFGSQSQSVQYNTNFSGHHTIYSPEFHAFTVSYDPSFLKGLLQCADERPLAVFTDSVLRKKNYLPKPYTMPVSGRIAEVIHTIQKCPFRGITRYIFIESKMMELFVLQMEQLHSLEETKPGPTWSRVDREKLFSVKEYIESRFLESFTLKELCLKFGLNEFKLKKGYRDLFLTTVFGHVHQLRMQKAKALLEEREMNVSDVAFFIGYNNVSSFSTEFKKRFGYVPRVHHDFSSNHLKVYS